MAATEEIRGCMISVLGFEAGGALDAGPASFERSRGHKVRSNEVKLADASSRVPHSAVSRQLACHYQLSCGKHCQERIVGECCATKPPLPSPRLPVSQHCQSPAPGCEDDTRSPQSRLP